MQAAAPVPPDVTRVVPRLAARHGRRAHHEADVRCREARAQGAARLTVLGLREPVDDGRGVGAIAGHAEKDVGMDPPV